MFQSAWHDNKKFNYKVERESIPSDFITTDKIDKVLALFFDEHCNECAAPQCYSTCNRFEGRKDGACRRLEYGIKHLKEDENLLWDVVFKFKNGGKIESRINLGTLTPKNLKRLNRLDKIKAQAFKFASKVLSPKNYKYSSLYDGLRRKKYSQIKSDTPFCLDFLFQCYYEGEPFNLFYEVTDKENKVIFKSSIFVKRGYNQEIIKHEFMLEDGYLVRLYPENNLQAELEVFALDFVLLKSSILKQPAKTVKCVCWDLDNTVWKGVLIESDPKTLTLNSQVLNVIKELDRRGIVQVVVSKNDKESVLPVLKRLKIEEYFVYVNANWQAKSYNIFLLSKILNIGLDTFALIDDSAFERGEVSKTLSCVRTYKETEIPCLLDYNEFNALVTEESKKRRFSYIEEAKRKQIKEGFLGNNTSFIKSCNLVVELKELKNDEQKARSLELLNRTNQLNLSNKRYTSEEFNKILSDQNFTSFVLTAKDKFGNYGQVAYLRLTNQKVVTVSEFAMSCRVAGKYIENALFNHIQNKYQKDVILSGIKTQKNVTLMNAFLNAGFKNLSINEEIKLCLPSKHKLFDTDVVKINEI